jgi:site-specific DNA recombinase
MHTMARKSNPHVEQGISRGVGYVRVSDVGGRSGDSFQSPEVQREAIAALAARHGIEVTRFETDLDESGGDADRPGWNRAIGAVEDGEAEYVLTAYVSRFGRSMRDTENAVKRIEDAGGRFIAADADIDPDSAMGVMLRQQLTMSAEMELRRFKDQWRTSKARALSAGKYLAKTAPVGYRFTEARRLVKSEHAEAVRGMFLKAAAGGSLAALVDHLKGATGHTYYEQSVRNMLQNRAYVGETVYAGATYEGTHEPIVSVDEWQAAQRQGRPKLKRSGTHSLLAGIAVCASCGKKMGMDRSGDVPIYKCPRKPRGLCKAPASISCSVLDVFVIERVRAWAQGEGLEDQIVEVHAAEDKAATAAELLQQARDELDGFAVDSVELRLPREATRKGLEARQEAVRRAEAAVQDSEAESSAATIRTSLRAIWPDLTTAERRQLIGAVLDRVTVRRRAPGLTTEDRVRLVWVGENGTTV